MLIIVNKLSGAVALAPVGPAPVELPVVEMAQPAPSATPRTTTMGMGPAQPAPGAKPKTLIGIGPARAKGGRSGSAPASFSQAVGASSGFALPRGLEAAFAPIVGGDLGSVRLHTDPAAQQASRAIGAEAFTLGQDIYFAPGRFNPGSIAGQALLAHELTHAEQFGSGAGASGPLRSASSGAVRVAGHDRFERQAEANERFVLSRGLQRAEAFGGAIHRKAAGDGMLRRSAIGRFVNKLFGRADGGISVRASGPGKCAIERLDVVWVDAASGSGPTMHHVQARGAGAAEGAAPAGFGALVAASAGQPLPTDVRGRAEAMLGGDFADVRVHTDAAAIAASESVGAQAFALAGHIYFNAGRYEPTSSRGMALLIHELTHIEQERGGAPTLEASGGTVSRKQGGSARAEAFARGIQTKSFTIAGHDRLERQAEANEAAVYRSLTTGGGVAAAGGGVGAAGGLRLRGYPGAIARSAEEQSGIVPVPDHSSDPEIQEAFSLFRQLGSSLGTAADLAVGFIPIVGDVYDVLCGIVGRALFTWEQLDVFERVLCFAGVIPIPFITGGLLRRGAGLLRRLVSERRVVRVFNAVIERAVAFVKSNMHRVRNWLARSRSAVRRASAEAAEGAVAFARRIKERVARTSTRATPEQIDELRQDVERLEEMIASAGLTRVAPASYLEFRALRMQGFSAQDAHGLMKRFRSGEAVDGFAFHFTDRVGGRGITTTNRLLAGKGAAGFGVYAGATPTPSKFQMRAVWGLGGARDVRIPIQMGDGKRAYEAVYPTKTYLFEVDKDMPLAGGITDIARKEPTLLRLLDRYSYAALIAAGAAAALTGIVPMLFKRKEGAGRLLAGEGLDPEDWLDEWSKLDPQQRRRLTYLTERMESLEQPGLPLEWSVRQRLESSLGQDLGLVTTYTGFHAEQLAHTIEAQAFTVGERIVFGSGSFAPETVEGMGTLVHEATHALQERAGRVPDQIDGSRRRVLEAEAYAAERSFVARHAPRERIAPEPFEPEYRREAAAEAAPPPEPKLAVPPSLSASLAKAVDDRPRPTEADPIQRVMESWQVNGMSREEFLEMCRERVLDLLHDELELDNERRETLAWNPFRPIA